MKLSKRFWIAVGVVSYLLAGYDTFVTNYVILIDCLWIVGSGILVGFYVIPFFIEKILPVFTNAIKKFNNWLDSYD